MNYMQILEQSNKLILQLDRAGNTTIFFIIEEAKETIFEFSQGTVKVLSMPLNAIPLKL